MNAYRPVYQASSPVPPTWHPPAMELSVMYPQPGAYARRKDASIGMGSFAYAPSYYGAEVAAPAPALRSNNEKAMALFKKDASGTSKAERIAKRGIQLFAKKRAAEPVAPPPVIVQMPAAPVQAGMSPAVEMALVGLAALGVGVGVGYALGRR